MNYSKVGLFKIIRSDFGGSLNTHYLIKISSANTQFLFPSPGSPFRSYRVHGHHSYISCFEIAPYGESFSYGMRIAVESVVYACHLPEIVSVVGGVDNECFGQVYPHTYVLQKRSGHFTELMYRSEVECHVEVAVGESPG